MKTKKLILGVTFLFIAGSLALTSCRKREKTEEKPPDNEQTTANDNANTENISNDIVSIGSELSETGTLTQYKSSDNAGLTGILSIASCATVTGVAGLTFTVDFGTTGCEGLDKRIRKGKLIFDRSGSNPITSINYRNPGYKMVITSQGYIVDDNLVSVNGKTVTNTTSNSIGSGTPTIGSVNLTWNIKSNITVTKSDGGIINWTCDRTKELTNTNVAADNCYHGQTLAIDWSKAKIKLNGSASGTNTKGEAYTAVATNLVRDFNCTPSALQPKRHPFISGTIEYKPGTRATRLFDYGSGGCDFNATVTINGVTYAITLP